MLTGSNKAAMSGLKQDIRRTEEKARTRKLLYVFIAVCAICGIIGGFVYWTVSDLPRVNAIEEYVPVESTKIYSDDGKVLAEFYSKEGPSFPTTRYRTM